jgi:biopolymer transport protein ExbD
MSYRPSKRLKRGSEYVPTNITPMMNLMVVLIPLLLASAEFVRLGIIELNLRPAAGEGEEMLSADYIKARRSEKKLDLAVTITDRGFYISSQFAVLSGTKTGDPSIPNITHENDSLVHDYNALSEKLYTIKNKVRSEINRLKDRAPYNMYPELLYPDSVGIIIAAEPNIAYQTVVSTMDAVHTYRRENQLVSLFEDVSLSPMIE